MTSHESFGCDVCPFFFIENFLKVHAFLIGSGEQHFDHYDDVHDECDELEGDEQFEVQPFVFDAEENEEVDESDSHQDVHKEIEGVELILDCWFQIKYFIVKGFFVCLFFSVPFGCKLDFCLRLF